MTINYSAKLKDILAQSVKILGSDVPDTIDAGTQPSVIYGKNGDDSLTLSASLGAVLGGNGIDTIRYAPLVAADLVIVDGGAGDDVVDVHYAPNLLHTDLTLVGGTGNDRITLDIPWIGEALVDVDAGSGDNIVDLTIAALHSSLVRVFSGNGDDVITIDAGTDDPDGDEVNNNYVNAGSGDNIVSVSATTGYVGNGAATNEIRTGSGSDMITSTVFGQDDDFLGNNIVSSGVGDDVVTASIVGYSNFEARGATLLDGGAGNDHLRSEMSFSTNVGIGAGAHTLLGGAGNDVLEALHSSLYGAIEQVAMTLDGGTGNDRLLARSTLLPEPFYGDAAATHRLIGGAGKDSLDSSITAEFAGALTNMLDGGDDADVVKARIDVTFYGASIPWMVNDLDGGTGDDRIEATLNFSASYLDSPAETVTFGENRLAGGDGADSLTASILTEADDVYTLLATSYLSGGAGNDALAVIGGVGNMLDGGTGDDMLTGGSGDDGLLGGEGWDQAIFVGLRSDYLVEATGDDRYRVTDLRDGAPDGVDQTSDIEVLQFADGRTYLAFTELPGASAKAYVSGADGAQDLRATADADGTILYAGGGNDILRGGRHADILDGGAGNDQMFGGGGGDQFRFYGTQIDGASDTDRIYDLDFDEGDVLAFGSYGSGTFVAGGDVSIFGGGGDAIISSWAGLQSAVSTSGGAITATILGNGNLALTLDNGIGQVQAIILSGGAALYEGVLL